MPTVEIGLSDLSLNQAEYLWIKRTWVRTPSWPHVPKHLIPVNPYTTYRDSIRQNFWEGQRSVNLSSGAITWYDNPKYRVSGVAIRMEHDDAYAVSGYHNWSQAVAYETKLKALGRIADQKVNLPVLTAEAGKTANLILSTATRVWEAYRAFVRGNFKEVAKLLGISRKTRHKTWLEYKYGWMPMLMDIKGTAELFAERELGDRPLNFVVQARMFDSLNWKLDITYPPFGSGTATAKRTRYFDADFTARVIMWIEVLCPHKIAAQQLGLTNPALVVWELIPFSFVLDWFISVGDWLKALTAMNGLVLQKAMISNLHDIIYQHNFPQTLYATGGVRYEDGRQERWMNRRAYGRSSFTDVLPNFPEFKKPPDSLSQLVTALALLKGGFRGRDGPKTLRL